MRTGEARGVGGSVSSQAVRNEALAVFSGWKQSPAVCGRSERCGRGQEENAWRSSGSCWDRVARNGTG